MIKKKLSLFLVAALMTASMGASVACAQSVTSNATSGSYTSTKASENSVLVDGKTVSLSGVTVTKSGNGSGGDADFYGTNAAVLAKNGATLTLKNSKVTTNGSYANGVFSYGSGTTVNVSDTTINTTANNSGGIMTTGGATMKADNLTVTTKGNSSAPIRSDRGGGTVTVTKGTYTANGTGSPGIYSTADITATGATITSNDSEAVVIEGGNSVTLNNDTVTGNNKTLNGQSKVKTNVMIYQSMSGDASEGNSKFTMKGGSMTSKVGCMFYVTNTTTSINLSDVKFTGASGDEFLTVAAGPWGNSGSNGGNVTLNAKSQSLTGDISVDSSSTLNLKLSEKSTLKGAIESDGETYVEVPSGSTWTLTGDSEVESLTCSADSINLNGHTLKVDGKTYKEGTESKGSEVEQSTKSNQNSQNNQNGNNQNGQPPAMPGSDSNQSGNNRNGQPPAMPGSDNNQNNQNGQPPEPPTDEDGNPLPPPDMNGQNGDQNSNSQNGQPPEPPTDEDGNPLPPPDMNGQDNNQNGNNQSDQAQQSDDKDDEKATDSDKSDTATVVVKPGKTQIKKLTAGKNKLTVTYKKVKNVTRYQIAVKQKGASKWKYYTSKTLKKTVKKLKAGKKYVVKVRAQLKSNGKWLSGKWSKSKTKKVKKAS